MTASAFQLLYWNNVSTGTPGVGEGIMAVFLNLSGAAIFFLRSFAASILHQNVISSLSMNSQLLIGLLLLVVYTGAAYIYYSQKMWNTSIVPMALILYTFFYSGLLVIARFGLGFDNATAPRYSGELITGVIGATWIINHRIHQIKKPRIKWSLIALSVISILAVESVNIRTAKSHDRALANQLDRQINLLHEAKYEELAQWFIPGSGALKPVEEGDQLMRKHRLGPYKNKKID